MNQKGEPLVTEELVDDRICEYYAYVPSSACSVRTYGYLRSDDTFRFQHGEDPEHSRIFKREDLEDPHRGGRVCHWEAVIHEPTIADEVVALRAQRDDQSKGYEWVDSQLRALRASHGLPLGDSFAGRE